MPGLAEVIRLRTADCRRSVDSLPKIAAGDEVPPAAQTHVDQCLRCQAEVAAYRRLLRHLRALRTAHVEPPAGALATVLAALEEAAAEQHSGWALKAAYVGGITVATAAAGAAGVLVWMNRRRTGLARAV